MGQNFFHCLLFCFVLSSVNANSASNCDMLTTCATCTSVSHVVGNNSSDDLQQIIGCTWCSTDSTCHADGSPFNKCSSKDNVAYADTCLTEYPNSPPHFLPDWMKTTLPVIQNLTILDLSLPGTHDSLTYDLSLTVSDGGIDDYPELSKLLNHFSNLIPGQIEDFIRTQARTQGLSITQQLDNGVRFIDFRHMMESDGSWYSLHMLQSNQYALGYLAEIRDWLLSHDGEIVVVWMTKHGSELAVGEDAFPGVTPSQKQAYWKQVVDLMENLIIDTRVSQPNKTPIHELIANKHRFIPYVGDFVEFTGPLSFHAMDGKLMDNELGSSIESESDAYRSEIIAFSSANERKLKDKPDNKSYLRSMATSSPSCQIEAAAYLKFDPLANKIEQLKSCTEDCFDVPSLHWCPETLMDLAQLGAYYKQISLETCYNNFDSGCSFPNGIYLDSLDYDGTIRVGTTLPWGVEKVGDNVENKLANYPYVDTLIGCNIKSACESSYQPICEELLELIEERRAKFEIKRWEDDVYGRSKSWPVENIDDGNKNSDKEKDTNCQHDLCHVCVPDDTISGSCCDPTNLCYYDLVFQEYICLPDHPWICS